MQKSASGRKTLDGTAIYELHKVKQIFLNFRNSKSHLPSSDFTLNEVAKRKSLPQYGELQNFQKHADLIFYLKFVIRSQGDKFNLSAVVNHI